jgi:hypothetical protein
MHPIEPLVTEGPAHLLTVYLLSVTYVLQDAATAIEQALSVPA